ncbi:hypothetical protein M413DRAFT_240059 [Hebeloma cylindrosporum]|uniref:Carbohydrate-binding module family 18 protein n=1 Tax=Hebeloma cylindrosporum TaxID=76867 RepID=A0A0C2YCD8_HEBCY|nr:hypothetical protein M413DRAFT_240059 [Hebeloma cylindrosporum h7]
MNPFTLLVALATVLTTCKGTDPIPGRDVIRQTNTSISGGFATRSPTCLTNQVDCGGGVTQEICCPSGTFCFHSDDGVCCPTGALPCFYFIDWWFIYLTSFRRSDEDCNSQFFAAPQCADPSWVLCTDYQPNIPTYVPNDPGYWCCPSNAQCLVSPEGGFVCSAVNNGDIPGLTVLSGQAPTQASTATTLPTVAAGSATAGSNSLPTQAGSAPTKAASTTPSSVKNSAFKASSSFGIYVAPASFVLVHAFLQKFV